jgi:hypothetical protein
MFFGRISKSQGRRSLGSALVFGMCVTGLLGCFTEVGNAEDEQVVKASFNIDYSMPQPPLVKRSVAQTFTPSIHIQSFRLKVREGEFHYTDRTEEYLWMGDTSGQEVDFTGKDSLGRLPPQFIPKKTISNLKLEFVVTQSSRTSTSPLDLDSLPRSNWIVGKWTLAGVTETFLFPVPAGRFNLFYSQTALDQWKMGNAYDCQFTFFAAQWFDGIDIPSATRRLDKLGRPYILFDSNTNPTVYAQLVKKFYKSFNTASVMTN